MAHILRKRIINTLFAAGICFTVTSLCPVSASAIEATQFLQPIIIKDDKCLPSGQTLLLSEITEESWYQSTSGSLYYCYADGSYATKVTTLPNGETYLFALDGTLKTGWQSVDGKRFYYDRTTGQKKFGWILHSDRLYYVWEETGKQVGETIIDGTPYIFDEFGVLQTGIHTCESGTVAGCDANAIPYSGWVTDAAGATYYFNENGIAVTGLIPIEGSNYYFGTDGKMQTGWITLEEATYYFDPTTGIMATGTITLPEGTYTFDENGLLIEDADDTDEQDGIFYDVSYYNQADSRWGSTYIGTKTIAQVGCLVTSFAMTESYFTGTEILPDVMCKEYLEFNNNSLLWAPVIEMGYEIESCSGLSQSAFLQRVFTLLKETGPVIVGCNDVYGGSHYVVVTGCTNMDINTLTTSDFLINDPGFTNKTTLDEHLAKYPTWFRFFYKAS